MNRQVRAWIGVKPFHKQSGLTLLELVVTLLILTMLSTVALQSTSGLQDQARFEQTQNRLQMIREAILGDPRKTVNGQMVVSGFVADMGRLPNDLRELLDGTGMIAYTVDPLTGLGYGWRGPYLLSSQNPGDSDAFTDGWGREAQGYCSDVNYTTQLDCTTNSGTWTNDAADRNYGWWYGVNVGGDAVLLSYGSDQIRGIGNCGDDYKEDCFGQVLSQDYQQTGITSLRVNFIKPGGSCSGTDKYSSPVHLRLFIRNNGGMVRKVSDPNSSTLYKDCTQPGVTFNFSGANAIDLRLGEYAAAVFEDATGDFSTQAACEANKGYWDAAASKCDKPTREIVRNPPIADQATCNAEGGWWESTVNKCFGAFVTSLYWPRSSIAPIEWLLP
ncbi:prepilin-type N-terminal cleavage/methylation domain-containing protein [Methylocaldum sp.]|uniref:prepilin-type N-terminal cleavage/methylation domain-containing protein n=1 Tax=Methylocaldum sp. TaxID=1969727 RepID=UPI002D4B4BB8|nr:prepilin-type N-terminal cleavage/methylation domain-containing protein [Methylocaldum sp.]HYE36082.1 prepilin-type N-terminal cleavage/methylation domain-containing protein [Methylocaldum sp.]